MRGTQDRLDVLAVAQRVAEMSRAPRARDQKTPECTAPPCDAVRPRRRAASVFSSAQTGHEPGNKGKRYAPMPLTHSEVLSLNGFFGTHPAGRRDWALTVLLYRLGLRVSCEALQLRRGDLNRDEGTLFIRHGKNGWTGYVAVDDWTWGQLEPWLERRGRYPLGPLFCVVEGPTKGAKVMSVSTYRLKLHKVAAAAGITKRVHPHGLRHSHACELDIEGYSLAEIQQRLRHSNASTTGLYLRGMPTNSLNRKLRARPAPGQADEDVRARALGGSDAA